jgi:hypothetical protein
MSKAYRIRPDGSTEPLDRIHVRNEERDLQLLLEKNPDLLAGEQIRPEDPCRWLLVGREIAVPDPESGADRWNLDLFFVDQDATPTLVECKRFEDTRSRREVVAQMLDYAANANYYWTRDYLLNLAKEAAERQDSDLETQLSFVAPDWEEGPEDFFQRVEDNLREGQVRMVFFLEESPWQLRSIVEFLNRQMERSEVLLIEARQYEDGELRVVVPSLFGYTEEARRVKRKVSGHSPARRQWNRDSLLDEIEQQIGTDARAKFAAIIDQIQSLGADMSWGRGAKTGSTNPKWQRVASRSLVSIYTDGKISLNFPWLNTERDTTARDKLYERIRANTDLEVPDTYLTKYPIFTWSDWEHEAEGVIKAMAETIADLSSGVSED